MRENRDEATDLATVESQRNDLVAEEFPDGPYGTPLPVESLGKSTPWREDQRPPNRFSYENRELHEGLQRNFPGDHETHDESAD
uniref:Cytosolic protein n=1 Tax=Paenibacillus athensensis TaxID=1967502 RepID=A0A4Y8Q1Z8_9BACL